MKEPHVDFFITESAAHSKTLRLGESIKFLRGLVAVIGNHPAAASFRATIANLQSGSDQLELIEIGQLQLKFDKRKAAKK